MLFPNLESNFSAMQLPVSYTQKTDYFGTSKFFKLAPFCWINSDFDGSKTNGAILVRKKWSGQEVPSGASFAKSLELINSNTRASSVKCPAPQPPKGDFLRSEAHKPRKIGAIWAALFFLSSEERDSIFCPPKTDALERQFFNFEFLKAPPSSSSHFTSPSLPRYDWPTP